MGRGCGGQEWKPRVRHWCWWCAGLEFQQGCGGHWISCSSCPSITCVETLSGKPEMKVDRQVFSLGSKFQALVYDILPPTIALTGYGYTNKCKIVWIETELNAPGVNMCASVPGCFHTHVSTQTFWGAITITGYAMSGWYLLGLK